MDFGSSFDHNITIISRLMKDNMTICPTRLEKFEYLRTNGRSKAGVYEMGAPTHYYIRMLSLSFLCSLEPIARVAFGMSIAHGTSCPIE